jgi:hypothetical protein
VDPEPLDAEPLERHFNKAVCKVDASINKHHTDCSGHADISWREGLACRYAQSAACTAFQIPLQQDATNIYNARSPRLAAKCQTYAAAVAGKKASRIPDSNCTQTTLKTESMPPEWPQHTLALYESMGAASKAHNYQLCRQAMTQRDAYSVCPHDSRQTLSVGYFSLCRVGVTQLPKAGVIQDAHHPPAYMLYSGRSNIDKYTALYETG